MSHSKTKYPIMAKKDRSRAPSDDEGVAAIVPASLKGLDDDTVLIVTCFLPECRDVTPTC